jgi:hypothetical protein
MTWPELQRVKRNDFNRNTSNGLSNEEGMTTIVQDVEEDKVEVVVEVVEVEVVEVVEVIEVVEEAEVGVQDRNREMRNERKSRQQQQRLPSSSPRIGMVRMPRQNRVPRGSEMESLMDLLWKIEEELLLL